MRTGAAYLFVSEAKGSALRLLFMILLPATYRLGYDPLWQIVRDEVNRRILIQAQEPQETEQTAVSHKKVISASLSHCNLPVTWRIPVKVPSQPTQLHLYEHWLGVWAIIFQE
jgi:hypothetical protein